MDNFNYYQIDPGVTLGDTSGRYPPNFVKFPWFLEPINWGDTLSRTFTGKPAYRVGDNLLKVFDSVEAPAERWGTAAEISVLRESLVLLSSGFDENPYISPIGRIMLKGMITRQLKNRTAIIRYYEANREFIEAHGRYRAPLLVTGAGRTGTTLLHRLLSEDMNARSPCMYELDIGVPPLRSGADPARDPRVRKSARNLALAFKLLPGLLEKAAEAHPPLAPLDYEESMFAMMLHNGLHLVSGVAAGREYIGSTIRPGVADALFKYERNFFTMLDASRPPRSHWINKSPGYAPYFGKIFEYYPDAHVVVTHRHPAENAASGCRLIETSVLPFDREGSFDKLRFGAQVQEGWSAFWSLPLEFRQANPQYESQIIDCMYPDLIRDPIGMVKSIYAKFNLEYTPEFEERMKHYLANNQQGKHGRHKYTNEEYGIDPYELYQRNKAYFDHYGFGPAPGGSD